jgi:hypothetical protein
MHPPPVHQAQLWRVTTIRVFLMKSPRWSGIMCEAGNCVCDQDHIQSTGLTAALRKNRVALDVGTVDSPQPKGSQRRSV